MASDKPTQALITLLGLEEQEDGTWRQSNADVGGSRSGVQSENASILGGIVQEARSYIAGYDWYNNADDGEPARKQKSPVGLS